MPDKKRVKKYNTSDEPSISNTEIAALAGCHEVLRKKIESIGAIKKPSRFRHAFFHRRSNTAFGSITFYMLCALDDSVTDKEFFDVLPRRYLSFCLMQVVFGSHDLKKYSLGRGVLTSQSDIESRFVSRASCEERSIREQYRFALREIKDNFGVLSGAIATLESGKDLTEEKLRKLRWQAESFDQLSKEVQLGIKMRVYSHDIIGRALRLYQKQERAEKTGADPIRGDDIARIVYLFASSFGFAPEGRVKGKVWLYQDDPLYQRAQERGARSYTYLVMEGAHAFPLAESSGVRRRTASR